MKTNTTEMVKYLKENGESTMNKNEETKLNTHTAITKEDVYKDIIRDFDDMKEIIQDGEFHVWAQESQENCISDITDGLSFVNPKYQEIWFDFWGDNDRESLEEINEESGKEVVTFLMLDKDIFNMLKDENITDEGMKELKAKLEERAGE